MFPERNPYFLCEFRTVGLNFVWIGPGASELCRVPS